MRTFTVFCHGTNFQRGPGDLLHYNRGVQQVNIIGWGRGAVAGFRIANKLG